MLLAGSIYSDGKSRYRLIHSDSKDCYVIKLDNRRDTLPQRIDKESFSKSFKNSEYKEEGFSQEVSLEDELTKKQIEKRDFYYEVINHYWSDADSRKLLLNKNTRRKVIRKISVELGIGERQTIRQLSKFFKGGMTRNSLTPDYRNRSGKQTCGKRKGLKGEGLALDETMRQNFEKGYQKYYLREKRSLNDSYERICRQYYKEAYERNDDTLKPTFNQFYNWVRTNKSRFERDQARSNSRDFMNNKEVLNSYSYSQAVGIGDRFEADATHLDISLVSEADRKTIVGKPLLITVIDVYSSMIVGINLSLQNESWETYAAALYNTVEDKVSFARDYGLEIDSTDWPNHYLPASFLCDNGAGKSRNIQPITYNYGMDTENPTPYKGSAKGKVERSHRKFEDYIKANLPGALKDDAGQRGAPDYSKEACLTLSDLTRIIILLVIKFNNKPIDKQPIDPDMALAGKSYSPKEIWEYNFDFNNNLIGVGDLDVFKIITSPHKFRKPHRDGIHINNLVYTLDGDRKLYYEALAEGKKLEVHYDILDIRYIYVRLGENYYRFRAKDSRLASVRISLEELREIARHNKENRKKAEFRSMQKNLDVDSQIEAIFETARTLNTGTEPFDLEERQKEIRRKKVAEITTREATVADLPNASDRFDRVRKEALRKIREEENEKNKRSSLQGNKQ